MSDHQLKISKVETSMHVILQLTTKFYIGSIWNDLIEEELYSKLNLLKQPASFLCLVI